MPPSKRAQSPESIINQLKVFKYWLIQELNRAIEAFPDANHQLLDDKQTINYKTTIQTKDTQKKKKKQLYNQNSIQNNISKGTHNHKHHKQVNQLAITIDIIKSLDAKYIFKQKTSFTAKTQSKTKIQTKPRIINTQNKKPNWRNRFEITWGANRSGDRDLPGLSGGVFPIESSDGTRVRRSEFSEKPESTSDLLGSSITLSPSSLPFTFPIRKPKKKFSFFLSQIWRLHEQKKKQQKKTEMRVLENGS